MYFPLKFHRHFDERDLGMMKTVCPDAYVFSLETDIPGEYSAGCHFYLTISIKTKDPQLTAASLVKRRQTFYDSLVLIVKRHHREFLSNLDPPLDIPDQKVLRWHSGFSPDSVPAIEVASLPTLPSIGMLGLQYREVFFFVVVVVISNATIMPSRKL